ncbi:MAG: hypothetical protein HFJ11_05010 [Bacilli bacterium]|nr:hypothetical protein [Bacilli bacterium]
MKKPLKIVYDKNKSFEVEKGYTVDNFLSSEDEMGYSIVRTHLDGRHPFMKNIRSNRTYFLLNGSGIFYFDDDKIEINSNEMLTIPKNTKYSFVGKFDCLLIDCPAFNKEDDIIYNKEEYENN